MDSMITAAAQALASGNPLGALTRVALRDDGPALALRGIIMAQLGDLDLARGLLKRARQQFGDAEAVASARCLLAEAEIALVSRDLASSGVALGSAREVLTRQGDRFNAAHARNLMARYLLLKGQTNDAEAIISDASSDEPPALQAARLLVVGGIAVRRLEAGVAATAFHRAEEAARQAGLPGLISEAVNARHQLALPVGRLVEDGTQRPIALQDVESVLKTDAVVVDAFRRTVSYAGQHVALSKRPILFALLRALAENSPHQTLREVLIKRAFGARDVDEPHRARLRVEISRLRALMTPFARLSATSDGFALTALPQRRLILIAPPETEKHSAVLALMSDGEAWSSSALAVALARSSRSVQRALDDLKREGKVLAAGNGASTRWVRSTLPGFPTHLLLPRG